MAPPGLLARMRRKVPRGPLAPVVGGGLIIVSLLGWLGQELLREMLAPWFKLVAAKIWGFTQRTLAFMLDSHQFPGWSVVVGASLILLALSLAILALVRQHGQTRDLQDQLNQTLSAKQHDLEAVRQGLDELRHELDTLRQEAVVRPIPEPTPTRTPFRWRGLEWQLTPQFWSGRTYETTFVRNISLAYLESLIQGPVCPACGIDASRAVTTSAQCDRCGSQFGFEAQDELGLRDFFFHKLIPKFPTVEHEVSVDSSFGKIKWHLGLLRAEAYEEAQEQARRGILKPCPTSTNANP